MISETLKLSCLFRTKKEERDNKGLFSKQKEHWTGEKGTFFKDIYIWLTQWKETANLAQKET